MYLFFIFTKNMISNIFNIFSCCNVCSVLYEFIYSCGDMEWYNWLTSLLATSILLSGFVCSLFTLYFNIVFNKDWNDLIKLLQFGPTMNYNRPAWCIKLLRFGYCHKLFSLVDNNVLLSSHNSIVYRHRHPS